MANRKSLHHPVLGNVFHFPFMRNLCGLLGSCDVVSGGHMLYREETEKALISGGCLDPASEVFS